MTSDPWKARKVVIVGAGAVGATFAYALAQRGISDDISLVDQNHELAQGQALDLAHGVPFFPSVTIRVGGEGKLSKVERKSLAQSALVLKDILAKLR